jgi:nucleolar complex protein 2
MYIPLAPIILEPLDSSLMKTLLSKKTTSTVLKPVEWESTIRVSGTYLSGPSSRVYRDQVAEKMVVLLAEFFDLHGLNPAFPELVLPPTIMIKKWLKKHGGDCGGKVRHVLLGLVEHLDLQAKWVEEKRRGIAFTVDSLHTIQSVKGDDGPLHRWIARKQS